MTMLAIIYHSAHGHTEFIARRIYAGASSVENIAVDLVKLKPAAESRTSYSPSVLS